MASISRTLPGLSLVVSLMVVSWSGVSAQSSCTPALTSLVPCLNYVTGNASTPSSSCCSQLAFVVQVTPVCLCSLFNGTGPSFGVTVNQTQALRLPGACNVMAPPINQCNAATANAPTTSAATPATAPAAAPAEGFSNETPNEGVTPSASTTPSQGGSKAVPSPPSPVSSGVGSIKVSLPFIMSLFLVGSYAFRA